MEKSILFNTRYLILYYVVYNVVSYYVILYYIISFWISNVIYAEEI